MDDKERVTLKCLDCGNEFTMTMVNIEEKQKIIIGVANHVDINTTQS